MQTLQHQWKTAAAFLLVGFLLGVIPSLNPENPVPIYQIQREYPDYSHCGEGRHHGPPPPPPGLPPTVLFLLGGALGYLIGRQRNDPTFPPPHYPVENHPIAK